MLTIHAPVPSYSQLPQWTELRWFHVLRWPLRHRSSVVDRALIKLVCIIALRQVVRIEGWENVLPQRDPFLLVANHSSRREAVFLLAILLLVRGGRTVRFLADWNFRLIPGAGPLYHRTGAITLTRKRARPRILNLLRPLFEPKLPPLDEARNHLLRGGSVGIFPEGTVNRNANRLLRGHRAAARLSLETGVPVVPLGIRFSRRHKLTGELDSSSALTIHIGEVMTPQCDNREPVPPRIVTGWNERIMLKIGQLCGKELHGTEHSNGIGKEKHDSLSSPLHSENPAEETPCRPRSE